ncbi:hypothetical protein BU23DRAFT_458507 [Bimuria novae-zelandiae CBS 107.79]|uniref:Uncharacterized protein n=1 Tax=Bimuria novae-zelandiae CBS 107.79 TaxID=1447943 RepID=A0A6A5VE69_9PLEO|nr:hypothetical protein BU23DRAFT_458507 [Bimuria novae-zelandiae CBS 107.79]
MAAIPERNPAFVHCGPLNQADISARVRIFLRGSIEMGKAPNWQATFTDKVAYLPIAAFNPRRIH